MPNFEIHFSTDFSEYEWEIEAKGWYGDLPVTWRGKLYMLNFFDPVRLNQDLQGELEQNSIALLLNTVIIDRLTKNGITEAVSKLVNSGELSEFKSENSN
ncbi:MAG: hypothetical protein V7776_03975 [Halopseudomonas aestusnigri]